MSSILKVDQIQLTNGSTPTAGDLGLNTTGSVLQSKVAMLKYTWTSNTNDYVDISELEITITPKATNSTVILRMCIQGDGGDATCAFRFWRQVQGGTATIPNLPNSDGNRQGAHARIGRLPQDDGNHFSGAVTAVVTDEPNTTSPVTYKVQGKAQNGVTMRVNMSQNYFNTSDTYGTRTVSTLEVMEIAG